MSEGLDRPAPKPIGRQDPTWQQLVQSGRSTDWTELGWAVECLDIDGVRRLLDAGADANEPFMSGTLPLHWALGNEGVIKSHEVDDYGCEISRLLVEHGADLSATDSSGRPALDQARLYLDTGVEQMILAALAARKA